MNFDDLKEQIAHPIDVTDQYDPADIAENKGISMLACFPALFWIPLVARKDSAYGRFCANQGLITMIISCVSTVLGIIPFLGWILSGVLGLVCLASFVFTIYHVSQGKAVYLPVLGEKIEVFK